MTDWTAARGRTKFRRRFFPAATAVDWRDWRWQLRNRFLTADAVERLFPLTEDEHAAIAKRRGALPLAITPYYAALVDPNDPDDPIRKTLLPVMAEYERAEDELEDPLGEQDRSPVPGLVHSYPDKVLFLVSDFCATYCRYCTRSRLVGAGETPPDRNRWEAGLEYIREHKEVRDVLLSGGDPLTLGDERLEWLLSRLAEIPHVEYLRIGTKVPVTLPQRITLSLTRMLRSYHPLFFSIHFTHPRELTDEVGQACQRLADAGIPLGSQTVLLKGVNDDVEIMRALMQGLLRIRVKPYYLHQCDAVAGSFHFRTPIQTGEEIIRGLHGHTSGYAVPTYMLDAPGGGGKVPLTPSYTKHGPDGWIHVENHNGHSYRYQDKLK